ncbi:MAG: malate/lactate/ureidoglycolate dehydrogenase [Alphaproteobacteria bacterium]|nr:malate/lactate/ureidoglycolate dehydrogenase [Alphaproteobacteria bacterium]
MSLKVDAEQLEALIAEIFDRAGCMRDEAERIAMRLLGANLTGHDSHGVIRTSRYIDWLTRGMFHAGRKVHIGLDTDALCILDGQYGFGQTIGEQAVRLGLDKAAKNGAAVVSLNNSGHLGRIGDWAEMAAAEGFVSIHFVNARGSVLVAPFGGAEARFSTAPFCVGVPRGEEPPVILDFATSIVAEGKVLVAYKGGKPLPEGALIDENGTYTSEPEVLYGSAGPDAPPAERNGYGAIRAMGDHKGSGLAFICELLGGSLTGNRATGLPNEHFANGMLSIYLSVEVFDQGGGFADDIKRYIDYVKSAKLANADEPILVPGDKERAVKADRLANGLPLSDDAWADIVNTARRVGMEEEEISEIAAPLP